MKNAKKIRVTTLTSEVIILRHLGYRADDKFCPVCQDQTRMVGFDSAVTLFRIGARELIRLIDSDAIHSIETTDGHLLICSHTPQRSGDADINL